MKKKTEEGEQTKNREKLKSYKASALKRAELKSEQI